MEGVFEMQIGTYASLSLAKDWADWLLMPIQASFGRWVDLSGVRCQRR